MIEQYTSPVAVNNSQEPWLVGEGVVVSGGVAIPSLDFNFITGGLPGTVTFTRASTATYFNSAGVLTSASNNVPRFDYNPSTLAARGLLIEEARTNLLTYSAQFDNAAWLAISAKNVTSNTDTAPDGTLTADTVSDVSAAAYQGIQQGFAVAADTTTYTFTVYVKKTTGGISATFGINLSIAGGTSVLNTGRFNTDTGAILSGTASVQNAGNYWRFVVSVTNNGSVGNTALTVGIYPATAAHNGSDTPTATGSAVIWGAQTEAGAFPTSYIPTTTTALTRSADVASVNTLAPWFNAAEGTLYVEGILVGGTASTFPNQVGLVGSNANTDNIRVGWNSNASTMSFGVRVAGTSQAGISAGANKSAGSSYKVAGRYAVNNFQAAFDGTLGTPDTSGTLPTITSLLLGGEATFQPRGNLWLRRTTYYPRALSDAELQAITA